MGNVGFGSTNNEAELHAVLAALQWVVDRKWGYWGDYVEIRSDSGLAMKFLCREWKPK